MNKTALLFSGQGAQHVGMGKDLYEAEPVARDLFEIGRQQLGDEFITACFEGPEETLTQTRFCQPALYIHGLALLKILQDRRPNWNFHAAAGLSLGEFTAHAAAGHFSDEDGLTLVATRGRLMQEACDRTNGGMLALIGADEAKANEIAASTSLEIANLNSPGQIVLSGPLDQMDAAVEAAKSLGIKRAVPLQVAGAYHSSLMESARAALSDPLNSTKISDGRFSVYANIHARPVSAADDIRRTLLEQVTGSVRWQQCIQNMIEDGITHFVELGPGGVLAGMCKRINKEIPTLSLSTLTQLEECPDEL
jgi:[acyl-carrier-protein] S-malonyltransferase